MVEERLTVQIAQTCHFEQRRRRLDAAIAHLKRRCILVDVVNRDAHIRTYRVSGKRDAKLAEEVIEIAQALGFEVVNG